jgi:hypothetical protein
VGSDIARISFDPTRQYRSVVLQQGRVTLEADSNEASRIASEALRLETIDIIGPAGTPDDGYKVGLDPAGKVAVLPGIMYVGGWRCELDQPVELDNQPDWLNMPQQRFEGPTLVALLVTEQSVCAVEDQPLREVALGGPDSAARTRLMQHFLRLPSRGEKCDIAAKEVATLLDQDGVTLDPNTLQLISSATLQVGFVPPVGPPDPCDPPAQGGYLGADNQMVRVTVIDFKPQNGTGTLLWGWNNASILYRGAPSGPQALALTPIPIDAEHSPQQNQAVEILLTEADLLDGNDIAALSGQVAMLTQAYDPDTNLMSLPAGFTLPGTNRPLFVRLWQATVPFTSGTPVALDAASGLSVSVTMTALPSHIAARPYWHFAVRPTTPTLVYPQRYLERPQRPDGPRQWLCDLAVIFAFAGQEFRLLDDCRKHFCNLEKACTGGCCCSVTVKPADAANLQTIIDAAVDGAAGNPVTVCLSPGNYALTAPLALGRKHAGITIEGCGGGATFQAAARSEANFLDGMIVLTESQGVTLRGITFKPPLVPFDTAGGELAGLTRTQLLTLQIDLDRWLVSIGVRGVLSRDVTIAECSFLLSTDIETNPLNVFAVAIFAGAQCFGTWTLEDNFISYEGSLLANSSEPVRSLLGFVIAPSVIISVPSLGTGQIGGTVIAPVLEGANLRRNTFQGLNAAALLYANNGKDTGKLCVEGNTVASCYAGFWIFAQSRLGLLDLNTAHRSEPISLIASTIADAYPLPKGFDVSKAKPIVVAPTTPPTTFPPPSNLQGMLLGLYELRLLFSTLEIAAFRAREGSSMSLIMSDNDIEAIGTTANNAVLSGAAVAIATNNAEPEFSSTILLSTNKIDNETKDYPTATISADGNCALTVTGNLIFNRGSAASFTSLFVDNKADPLIAVTGNVFRPRPQLPARAVPAPLNDWLVLNTLA